MISKYRENQKTRLAGKVLGYPLYLSSPKLGQFLPSIQKGKCIHITANTDVGKSQYWKWHLLIAPYLIYKLNANCGFVPRWVIFLLEDTYEELYGSIVSSFIYIKFKKIVEPSKLKGFSETIVTDEELRLVEQVIPLVEELLSLCKVVDDVYHATGLFANARTELLKNGKRFYTTIKESSTVITEEEYSKLDRDNKIKFKFSRYELNDPMQHWFIVTDNINLIEPEKEEGRMLTIHEAIWKWSTGYAHKQLQKNYNCTVVDIVQQVADSEKQQFTASGQTVVEKVKPSRDGYGDNKRIARNAHVVLGLFAPTFYGIKNYYGIDLNRIGDNFRTVIILKNKIGRGFKEVPLYFNGACNYFAELPKELSDKDYQLILNSKFMKSFKKVK